MLMNENFISLRRYACHKGNKDWDGKNCAESLNIILNDSCDIVESQILVRYFIQLTSLECANDENISCEYSYKESSWILISRNAANWQENIQTIESIW